jgi:PleD family two-component response regulator
MDRVTKAKGHIEYENMRSNVKIYSNQMATQLGSGLRSANDIEDVYRKMVLVTKIMDQAKSVSGIAAYAQDQLGPGVDVIAEFTALESAVDTVKSEIEIVLNVDPTTKQYSKSVLAIDGINIRQITTTESAGLVTALNTLAMSVT